jgi:hypothetical protein
VIAMSIRSPPSSEPSNRCCRRDTLSIVPPKKSGLRPRKRVLPTLRRWQVLLAAVVAFFGAVLAALIPILASSPGTDCSGSGSLPGGGHCGSLAAPALTPFDGQVAITSWSEVPFSPAPGETFSFQGIVNGWSYDNDQQVFVIAKQTNGVWEVSPPAVVVDSQNWTVTWKIAKPPIRADWSAVIVLPPETAPVGVTSEPSLPSVAQYRADLVAAGLDSSDVEVNSTPVQVP